MFTQIEKDRLTEVLFYLYFNNKDDTVVRNAYFWNMINDLCKLYEIDATQISKASRILFSPENVPTEFEIWYLLNKLEVSVRPIKKISGIYWQKQKHFAETVDAYGAPKITRRVADVSTRHAIKSFIAAVREMFGGFAAIEGKFLEAFFDL